MSDLNLNAEPRSLTGGKVKQLRREGIVPVVVYGRVDKPVNLQVNEKSLERTLHHGGMSQLVELQVSTGEAHNVLIRDTQRHPVTNRLMHADFYAISMTETQEVEVAIVSVNEPTVMSADELVIQSMDTVLVEALPADIPASIEVDITELTYEHAIHVSDLPLSAKVTVLTDPEEVLFSIVRSRAAISEEGEEGEEDGLFDDSVEPEVIGRGKDEDDFEE
jgi:large subunit ribosomal protein L25